MCPCKLGMGTDSVTFTCSGFTYQATGMRATYGMPFVHLPGTGILYHCLSFSPCMGEPMLHALSHPPSPTRLCQGLVYMAPEILSCALRPRGTPSSPSGRASGAASSVSLLPARSIISLYCSLLTLRTLNQGFPEVWGVEAWGGM